MDSLRPDVVVDCNVLVQAVARKTGPAAQILCLVEQNRVTLHVSKAILRELRRTLAYPEVRQRNPQLTDEVIADFLREVVFRGVLHAAVPHVFEYARDPDDEAYVDLAAAIQADYLVTRDNDLLSLATDHSIEAKQFRQRFPRLHLVNPVAFLSAVSAYERP